MRGTKGFVVQPRDLTLLRSLAMLLVADCEQIKLVAGFGSTTRVNARLLQLVRAGLLRRFFFGSGGGRKALYALSHKGARLAGVPYRGPRRTQDEILVADFFIAHQLTVNRLYCQLKYQNSLDPSVVFHRWISFHQQITPNLGLIPDGYAEFRADSEILASFLEVDLGHESSAIWKQKTRNYLQLAVSGEFQELFGQSRFRVLVLANSDRRVNSIRKTVAAVTEKVFWFATLESVSRNFFAPVWFRPAGDKPKPFFEQTQ